MSKITLPNITLACIDSRNINAGFEALQNCMKYVDFGHVRYFTNFHAADVKGVRCIKIRDILSKENYSRFVFFELHKYIHTEFVMICQWDGYIINPLAWSDEFLKYDYIGAPWWRDETTNVGNGGFSIRSKRLMQYLDNPVSFSDRWEGFHPEDDMICRKYRDELERNGFRFAPENLAAKFSWEGNPKYPKYNGSFGFHGGRPK